jgi:hypothetical protein
MAEQLIQRIQSQQQVQQPTTQQQELGNTPEEREFWATQRRIAREEAERVSREQLGSIRPVIDAGRMELAQIKVQQFRAAHPDVKSNSPEEIAIAEKISQGYLPEDAYRVVMWDRRTQQVKQEARQEVKQTVQAKKQANTETQSLPQNSGLPTSQRKMTLNEKIREVWDKLEREGV